MDALACFAPLLRAAARESFKLTEISVVRFQSPGLSPGSEGIFRIYNIPGLQTHPDQRWRIFFDIEVDCTSMKIWH